MTDVRCRLTEPTSYLNSTNLFYMIRLIEYYKVHIN